MNLADYVSELLGTHDEVSMPGLGYFAFTRVYGYYNDEEAKFCPPRNEIVYNPQLKDDDTLAQYVADKKKISVATSKYFAEKFVNDLKEKADAGDFIFSNLGLFRTENGQLVFHPNKSLPDNSFYGYPSITINKLQSKEPDYIEVDHTEPVYEKPVYTEEIEQPELIADTAEVIVQPETEAEIETKSGLSGWLIFMIIAGVVVLVIASVYLAAPSLFKKLSASDSKQANSAPIAKPTAKPDTDTTKTDTTKLNATAKDSTTKTAAATIDTLKQYRFEIIIDAEKKIEIANSEIARYKKIGLNVKISTDLPGRRLKLTAGTYFTKKEADSVLTSLKKSRKVSNQSYIIPILPKK